MIYQGTTQITQIKQGTNTIVSIYQGTTQVWALLSGVVISGVAKVGRVFTATIIPSEASSLCTYQWYRNSTAISGATSSTYTTTTADRGRKIKCRAYIGEYYQESEPSATILQQVESLTITGTQGVGSTLTASVTPSGATGTYKWYRGTTRILDATSSTYTLVDADAAKTIKCEFVADGNYTGTVTHTTGKIYRWVNHTASSLSAATIGKRSRNSDYPASYFTYTGQVINDLDIAYNSSKPNTRYRINKITYGITATSNLISLNVASKGAITSGSTTKNMGAIEVTGSSTYTYYMTAAGTYPARVDCNEYSYVSDWDEWTNS